ncbi:MAG: penicillin-binding protein [Eubacterium sp.]|nr:penicillin-binding protein [Eubacterium sp.]MBR0412456.1 penicillin-binding protein [Eubacterium sp.]
MRMIAKRGIFLWILAILFVAGIIFLVVSFTMHGSEWAMKNYNPHLYRNGELIGAGTIYDCNDKILAQTVEGKRVYAEDETTRKSTLHTVGDPKNFISTGVQNTFDSKLTGYNLMLGVYNIERYGKGNDLKLTINSDLCNSAYRALNGRKGTIGIVNYKTGEVICAVSAPSYDVENAPDNLETSDYYEGVYINRLLSAHYVPGSTFKLVTAICAIENIPDIYSRTWVCNGGYTPKKGVTIECNANHGDSINFNDALAKSCNSVFAQLAIELGSEKLTATAKELGIGSKITISGEIEGFGGDFNVDGAADDLLGWTGIGQGDTRIAPITMLRISSAIANGGKAVSFNIIDDFANQAGKALDITLPTNKVELMSADTATKMKNMMRYNVESWYGDGNYPNLNLCAKSGTAQIDSNDSHNIAWFTGFMADDSHPYAFVVVVENGGSGSQTAGPIANQLLQQLI